MKPVALLALYAGLAALPALAQNPISVVNVADFSNRPVAPGSIAAVFGDFSGTAEASAQETPLPTTLSGVEVLFADQAAPLIFVSETQINLIVPEEIAAGMQPKAVPVVVRREGGVIAEGETFLRDISPAIFTRMEEGLPVAAVIGADGEPVSPDNPAAPESTVSIYATGAGTAVAEDGGEPVETEVRPNVYFGVLPGEVLFSGFSGAYPGLWQINVTIPEAGAGTVESGVTPILLSLDGVSSQAAVVWLE